MTITHTQTHTQRHSKQMGKVVGSRRRSKRRPDTSFIFTLGQSLRHPKSKTKPSQGKATK